MKVLFLNAPKRSGKDAIAKEICDRHLNFSLMKFATPLYKSVRELFALREDEWAFMYESAKEEPSERLMGMSPRQAMIWLSEDVMKPKFGQTYYGNLAANRLLSKKNQDLIYLITDSGFSYEACPVVQEIGQDNCYLVHINRKGTSFEGDSRGWWFPDEAGILSDHHITIDNNGLLHESVDELLFQMELKRIC